MTCRSCHAEIIWAFTEAGKRMPIDAEPCDDGNIVFTASDKVRVLKKDEEWDGLNGGRFKSHYATCKFAAQHRKAK